MIHLKSLLGLIALIVLNGCVVLYPIETIDIISVKKGATLTAPKDGYFLSEFYIQEVVRAKVKK
jgi:hypothetical protein